MTESSQFNDAWDRSVAGDSFPFAPRSVIRAYEYYWEVTHEQRRTEKGRRMGNVNRLISDFCDSFIQPPVYTAAMLMPLMNKLDDSLTSRNAYRALNTFLKESTASEQDDMYVLGMLSDRKEIAVFWRESIASIRNDHPEISSAFDPANSTVQLDKQQWMHASRLVQPDKLTSLLENINLESLLIQSAELLEWLSSDKAANNGETFEYVYAAESIFAPLCEIIGFDGLSMALQSKCAKLRYNYREEDEFTQKAAELLSVLGSHEQIEKNVLSMLEATLGEVMHEQVLKHSSPHNIVIGEGIAENDTRVVWRVKSLGSIAKKLERNGIDSMPMDIIGATLIVKDEQTLARTFATVLDRIELDSRIQTQPSPSRVHALHVRGDLPYIERVLTELDYKNLDDMAKHVDVRVGPTDGFRVAKVTFVFEDGRGEPMRVEMQINTEQDRVQARIGNAAHLLFKFSHAASTVNPAILESISGRKKDIGHNELVGPSRSRAIALKNTIVGLNGDHLH